VKWRPALWYNGVDGIKVGIHSKGDYMDYKGRYEASLWGTTRLLSQDELPASVQGELPNFISYDLEYRTGTEEWVKGSELGLGSRWNAGLSRHFLEWSFTLPSEKDELSLRFTAMQRPDEAYAGYLLDGLPWGSGDNRFVEIDYSREESHIGGRTSFSGSIRSQALSPSYDLSRVQLKVEDRTDLGPIGLRSRLFGQFGMGDRIPPESMLYLSGGNPEAMMEDPLTRARGFLPSEASGYGATTRNFHYGGGLGLRGYSGYLAPSSVEGGEKVLLGYRGISGGAFNLELEFQDAFGFRWRALAPYFDLRSYLFYDAGIMELSKDEDGPYWGPVRMDGGIGAALTLEQLGPIEEIDPVTLRFDLPLFLNRTPDQDPEFVQFRWLFGISRAF
jgi:aminopeptidase N